MPASNKLIITLFIYKINIKTMCRKESNNLKCFARAGVRPCSVRRQCLDLGDAQLVNNFIKLKESFVIWRIMRQVFAPEQLTLYQK